MGREGPPRRQGGADDDAISGAFEVAAKGVRSEEQRLCRHPSGGGLTRAAGAHGVRRGTGREEVGD